MDKLGFVRDGVIRLPPGFRFQPTDEELVFQYLKRKVFSYPLPASIIPEINVCKYDPWDLPGDMEQERYFFCNKEAKYRNGKRTNRMTCSGYWKATGVDKRIVSSKRNQIMGMKKTLVFYRGKPSHGSRTDWVMHEYCLVSAASSAGILSGPNSLIQKADWVVCRIFLRKKGSRNHYATIQTRKDLRVSNVRVSGPEFSNFFMGDTTHLSPISSMPTSSSSSNSTGITDVPSTGSDQEESSDYSGSSCFR